MRNLKDTTAARIREVRKDRGMTQQGVADRLKLLGSTVDRTAIAKIETGIRDVALLEALQIAQALDVAPVHLIVPTDADPGEEIELGPKMSATPDELRAWIRGRYPLFQDARVYFSHVPESEFDAGLPEKWEQAAPIKVQTSPDEERRRPVKRATSRRKR